MSSDTPTEHANRVDLTGKYERSDSENTKTSTFLERNRGRFVFVDEAYAMTTKSDEKEFGPKALEEINRFLSESGPIVRHYRYGPEY